ncbi:SPASM domain-containing protein [bacterium]|nr:SPASM domain-containing protein [bacterium]
MGIISQNLENLIQAYKYNKSGGKVLPAIYVIEPTNTCNLRCSMCPNNEISNKGFMDFNLFRQIVEQISDSAKTILLYFTGEPLLHERIVEMISFCKNATTARVVLSTNGTALDSYLANDLIRSGLDTLIIGIDGNSKQTYEKIRVGAKFQDVCSNVLDFINIRGNGHEPELYLKLVRVNQDQNEIEDFVRRWDHYPCKIMISDLSSWANQLHGICDFGEYSYLGLQNPRNPCADLWFKMVINCSGDVVQCCYDFSGKYILGNLRSQEICEIWNDNLIQKLREKHRESGYENISLCRHCSEWSSEEDEYQYFSEYGALIGGRP